MTEETTPNPTTPSTPEAEKAPDLQQQVSEWKDKYFRALAEVENTRKRLTKEKLESQGFAIQNVVVDFLQPFDHFEQALKAAEQASGEVKHWAMGFEMILQQMKQVLADHGVQALDSLNHPFDPHQHEAIETEETPEVPAGMVVQEFIRGYKMGNRVIRPARVKVSVAPTQTNVDGA